MNSYKFNTNNSEDEITLNPIFSKKSKNVSIDKQINIERKLELKKQKDILKQNALQEKIKNKLLKNEFKNLKPGECLKQITLMADRHLKEIDLFAKLDLFLNQSEINHDYIAQPIPCMINYLRTVTSVMEDEQLNNLKTLSKDYLQENMLLYLPNQDFFTMVNAFKLRKEGHTSSNIDFESFIRTCNRTLGENVNLSIVIIGLDNFLRKLKLKSQHSLHNDDERNIDRLTTKGDKIKITFYDIDETMLHMQLHYGLQIYFFDNFDDFLKFLLNFTKAIAEKPYKRSKVNIKDGRLCELLRLNQGVKYNAEVDGCQKVWLQQLQQFKNVSIDVANAIVDAYQSPLHLMQAYERCVTEHEKDHLLEDINIRRGAGITSTNRKVGLVLSKKISLFFNSTNPSEEIK